MKQLSKTELAIMNGKTLFTNRIKKANRDTMAKTELLIKKSNIMMMNLTLKELLN